MIEAGDNEYDPRNAMHDTAYVLAHAKQLRKPRVRKLEGKTGDDQNDKAGKQDQMLPALVDAHALHHRILHVPARGGLTAPDDEVVQEHRADNSDDHDGVYDPHPAHYDRTDIFGMNTIGQMHRRKGELLRHPLVTLAARSIEIGAVDRRSRVARWKDIVHAVATGTVRRNHRATLCGQTVITVQVG